MQIPSEGWGSEIGEVKARMGVGYDSVDVAALTARRIPLMGAGTANSMSVPEHALYLMLRLAKRGTLFDSFVWSGN